MKYWLMKSEPDAYSIDDLERDVIDKWDGTRNYQVRNMMRDDIKNGDLALFYHSNAGKETGVVGVMKVVGEAYPDPTQFDPKDIHYDSKSKSENPRWLCVDMQFVSKFPRTVTLAELKQRKAFSEMRLVQKGNRLSVMPVSKTHFEGVLRLAESLVAKKER